MTADLKSALLWVVAFMSNAVPRTLSLGTPEPPVLVFTDGAREGFGFRRVTIGGLILPPGRRPQVFGFEVPGAVARQWKPEPNSQAIGQAELYRVLVAKVTWSTLVEGRRSLFFIDNFSARFALISK